MTVTDEGPEAEGPEAAGPDRYTCDVCGEGFDHHGKTAPMRLGMHRKKEHGIAGAGGNHGRGPRAPRAPRPRPETAAAGPRRGGRSASRRDLEDGTRELYETLGLLFAMRGDDETALFIIGQKRFDELAAEEVTSDGVAGAASKAWAKVAQHNAGVEATLTKLLVGGEWAEVFGAHLPLLVLAAKRKPEGFAKVGNGVRSRVAAWRVRKAATAANGKGAKRRVDLATLVEERRRQAAAGGYTGPQASAAGPWSGGPVGEP